MRKFLILPFLFIFLFTACEQQEILELDESPNNVELEESNVSFQVEALTLKDIPNVANKVLKSTHNPKVFSKSIDGGDNDNNLTIDDTWILAATDSIGNTSYSFRAYVPDTPYNVFYNVLVKKTTEGTLNEPFMLRYEVDEDYWETYATSDREDATFQGNIEVYTLNGINLPALTRNSSNNSCEDDPCFTARAVNNGTGSSGGNGNSSGSGGGNGSCSGCGGHPGYSGNAGSNYSLAGVRPTGRSGSRGSVEVGVGVWRDSFGDENSKGRFNGKQRQDFSTSRSNCTGECPEDQMLVPVNESVGIWHTACRSFEYEELGGTGTIVAAVKGIEHPVIRVDRCPGAGYVLPQPTYYFSLPSHRYSGGSRTKRASAVALEKAFDKLDKFFKDKPCKPSAQANIGELARKLEEFIKAEFTKLGGAASKFPPLGWDGEEEEYETNVGLNRPDC